MRLGGAGTFGATTADLVREDLLAADPNQGFGLEFEVLVLASAPTAKPEGAIYKAIENGEKTRLHQKKAGLQLARR